MSDMAVVQVCVTIGEIECPLALYDQYSVSNHYEDGTTVDAKGVGRKVFAGMSFARDHTDNRISTLPQPAAKLNSTTDDHAGLKKEEQQQPMINRACLLRGRPYASISPPADLTKHSKLGGIKLLLNHEKSNILPVSQVLVLIISYGLPGRSDVHLAAAVVRSRQWPLISGYWATVHTETPKTEMIDNMFQIVGVTKERIFSEVLDDFYASTKQVVKPGYILIFRDMGHAGQFKQLLNIDLEHIEIVDADNGAESDTEMDEGSSDEEESDDDEESSSEEEEEEEEIIDQENAQVDYETTSGSDIEDADHYDGSFFMVYLRRTGNDRRLHGSIYKGGISGYCNLAESIRSMCPREYVPPSGIIHVCWPWGVEYETRYISRDEDNILDPLFSPWDTFLNDVRGVEMIEVGHGTPAIPIEIASVYVAPAKLMIPRTVVRESYKSLHRALNIYEAALRRHAFEFQRDYEPEGTVGFDPWPNASCTFYGQNQLPVHPHWLTALVEELSGEDDLIGTDDDDDMEVLNEEGEEPEQDWLDFMEGLSLIRIEYPADSELLSIRLF